MTILINGEEKRIGLGLSGGGFRAAGFHLGVFKKLRELGLLNKIDMLSCVSGGSIAGGFLAANWGQDDALDRLQTYLTTKTIAYEAVIWGAISPFHTNLDILAKSYDRDLFKEKRLDSLRTGPRIYFNATNLSTGNMFFFVAGGGGKSEMGEHELGQVDAPEFPICEAVAASSAFPPVFTPLKLDKKIYNPPEARDNFDFVTLTDGGVYDNMGVNPLLREKNELDYIIVSDAGKPFTIDETPTQWGPAVLKEGLGIMMEQIRGLEFQRMALKYQAGEKPKPIWFSIDSDDRYDTTLSDEQKQKLADDATFASSIKTHLKKLKGPQIDVLTRHSGNLLERRIKTWAPEIIQ